MLSFLSSFFFNSESSKKSYITNTLKTLNKPYDDVSNGINISITNTQNINDVHTVTIPTNFRDTLYIYIKKNLKDTNGDYVNCFYVHKYVDDKLKFVNRIKIIDLETIKIDANNERIPESILPKIAIILNKIIGNISDENIDLSGGKESNSENNNERSSERSTERSSERSTVNSNINNDSITNSDVQDFRYLKYKSKYNNLKNIMNTSVSELNSESNSS